MYKLLLSWRYLRTRFIALASIVSVTLGVATLIVVNSVMSGFVNEMYDRLHGVYADVDMSAPGLGEIYGADYRCEQIRSILGSDLVASTCVVQVPALLQFEFRGRPMTQQIMLLGIDDRTYGQVAEFQEFLLNRRHREQLDFCLHEDGYEPRLGEAGWSYRRRQVQFERDMRGDFRRPPPEPPAATATEGLLTNDFRPNLLPLPDAPPDLTMTSGEAEPGEETALPNVSDPFAATRQQLHPEQEFDALRDQYTGIILGVAISNRKFKDPASGETCDLYLLRPGDDVQLTLPTAGSTPMPITQNCTVVDFYQSNMHEYDANFAFMPLSKLQQIRGMIDPSTGIRSVSAIQMKLRPGANLDQARDKLNSFFPPNQYTSFIIQTWRDAQRPLLSAVMMELTILNILLFLIIAVAGFGILATFYMIVVEKMKDIGILKALGASRRGVMSIFLSYGCSLGLAGAGVGIGLGLLFVAYINEIADWIQFATGREVFDPTMYYFSQIPTAVSPWCVAWVAFGAVAIALMASVLPAIRAARLNPVETLRYE